MRTLTLALLIGCGAPRIPKSLQDSVPTSVDSTLQALDHQIAEASSRKADAQKDLDTVEIDIQVERKRITALKKQMRADEAQRELAQAQDDTDAARSARKAYTDNAEAMADAEALLRELYLRESLLEAQLELSEAQIRLYSAQRTEAQAEALAEAGYEVTASEFVEETVDRQIDVERARLRVTRLKEDYEQLADAD